jgi:hypothetical protein
MAVTEHLLRRGRIDAEHAVHGGAHGGGVGMAGIGDAAYLLQGLGNAGQGQDAVVDSETHAAITSKGEGGAQALFQRRIGGGDHRATQAHITVIQHQRLTGVTARCGRAKVTSTLPSSSTSTVHGSSGWR